MLAWRGPPCRSWRAEGRWSGADAAGRCAWADHRSGADRARSPAMVGHRQSAAPSAPLSDGSAPMASSPPYSFIPDPVPDSIWIRPRPSLAPGAFSRLALAAGRFVFPLRQYGARMSFAWARMSFVAPFVRFPLSLVADPVVGRCGSPSVEAGGRGARGKGNKMRRTGQDADPKKTLWLPPFAPGAPHSPPLQRCAGHNRF
ncbi:hypothetical protein sphantq_00936 [Sphingobium sp. AntQ-1]|nr:hypothetical protein sphantq_00936 [Sphingobium sp. AntQ-1]